MSVLAINITIASRFSSNGTFMIFMRKRNVHSYIIAVIILLSSSSSFHSNRRTKSNYFVSDVGVEKIHTMDYGSFWIWFSPSNNNNDSTRCYSQIPLYFAGSVLWSSKQRRRPQITNLPEEYINNNNNYEDTTSHRLPRMNYEQIRQCLCACVLQEIIPTCATNTKVNRQWSMIIIVIHEHFIISSSSLPPPSTTTRFFSPVVSHPSLWYSLLLFLLYLSIFVSKANSIATIVVIVRLHESERRWSTIDGLRI